MAGNWPLRYPVSTWICRDLVSIKVRLILLLTLDVEWQIWNIELFWCLKSCCPYSAFSFEEMDRRICGNAGRASIAAVDIKQWYQIWSDLWPSSSLTETKWAFHQYMNISVKTSKTPNSFITLSTHSKPPHMYCWINLICPWKVALEVNLVFIWKGWGLCFSIYFQSLGKQNIIKWIEFLTSIFELNLMF